MIESAFGYVVIAVFIIAYTLVIFEQKLGLRKSKPVAVAAGIIWILVAVAYQQAGKEGAGDLVKHNLMEYAELFLFLMAAMTYINVLDERRAFDVLRDHLVSKGFTLRSIFWITGGLAFVISPIADNLTTALLMGTVVMTVAPNEKRFVALSCVNVVVAANAGGAFSPFGDITTLMVWQKGMVEFQEFFALLLPSAVNWLVPATIMSLTLPNKKPATRQDVSVLKPGAKIVMVLFAFTIATAVSFENFLHLPPALGMMTGWGYLSLYGYFIKRREQRGLGDVRPVILAADLECNQPDKQPPTQPFDFFHAMRRIEFDTLMFFYGVILCVGGLGALGYLNEVSTVLYEGYGPTFANVMVGLLSSVVDNIPVMFAVLSMLPDMSHGQWLLVTLTAGVGGSLLSVGSAAGVALMGEARGAYTFFSHLKWTPVIALGYGASIVAHFWFNAQLF